MDLLGLSLVSLLVLLLLIWTLLALILLLLFALLLLFIFIGAVVGVFALLEISPVLGNLHLGGRFRLGILFLFLRIIEHILEVGNFRSSTNSINVGPVLLSLLHNLPFGELI